MGISICWDNPQKTAIRYDFDPSWTWDDFWAALKADDELIENVDHIVHLIFDSRLARFVPPNPGSKFRAIADQVHERVGLIIIVGTNAWFLTVSQMFLKLYGPKIKGIRGVKMVPTLEDARAIVSNDAQQIGVV